MSDSSDSVRPRPSAGLVLLRDDGDGLSVLLGRRSSKARFMPSVYVVPGGGLAPVDRRNSGFPEPLGALSDDLDAATRRDLLPFARAALRESFEETGALLADRPRTRAQIDASQPPHCESRLEPRHWAAYREQALRPDFGALSLIARAITPAGSPIRYHTRFFMADGTNLIWAGTGDGELEDIGWCPVDEVNARPLPEITGLVIQEALRRRRGGAESRSTPLYYSRGDRMLRR